MRKDTQNYQNYQNICSDEKPQVKTNDIISLKIYDTHTNGIDYHMITLVTEVTDKTIRLTDIELIIEPATDFDEPREWEIGYNTMQRADLETYKFVLLGTKETHPEYTL